MTGDFDDIFEAYYNLLRAEIDTPESDDDEYVIALRNANEAIGRWSNYDGTYWKELFATATLSSIDGTNTYAAPDDMQEAGGYINFGMTRIPIVDAQEAQFKSRYGNYAYFTGDANNGFTLNFNRNVTATGTNNITFVYYKKPTYFTNGGGELTEVPNPYFIVHRMLAQRLRPEENYASYQIAMRDAEDALKTMKLDNESGTWANPWSVADRSGATFGSDDTGSFFN